MNKLNIVSIGLDIPCFAGNFKSINSMASLSSYDIIIFQPSLYSSDYIYSSNNERAITSDGYRDIKKYANHWHTELIDALNHKKTVIILTTPNAEIRYVTGFTSPRKGEKTYSASIDYLYNHILPYYPKMRESKGNEITVFNNNLSSIIKQIYDSCKEYTAYEVIFEEIEKPFIPLLMTRANQIIGFMKKYESGGRLIFWPNINFDEDDDLLFEKDDDYFWTEDAANIGNAFVSSIITLHNALHSLQEPIPTWVTVEAYMTDVEKNILKKIEDNKNKQNELEAENMELNNKLQTEQKIKSLLYAQGKELENAVNYALTFIGLNVENYCFKTKDLEIDNLIDYNGLKIIGETEGKDKDAIAINKIRQLIINKEEYYLEEMEKSLIEPKGILFGNPERQKPIGERTLDFTEACKQLSISKKIALVKTQDLFDVVLHLKNNPNKKDFARKCIETMINTEAGIVQFPKID